jgi:2-keto-4-pentenoate hydratase/2-oxohepta-3-ene-1,7-dioic acid hydratase in catechol pathway
MRIARVSHLGRVDYGIVNADWVDILTGDIFSELRPSGEKVAVHDVSFLVPTIPSKILALGINYRSHAKELNLELPTEPLFFYKPPSSLIGMGDPIEYPIQSKRVDYEAELGIVIGRTAKGVPVARALDYVLGYTCFNDVTARDIQWVGKTIELVKSKSFDTFGPVGPWIETELDASDLKIECLVNGVVKQSARTSDLVFGIAETVSYLSSLMTLSPGDLIATGTPSGIGPLDVGSVVTIQIEGIGSLQNRVVSVSAQREVCVAS